MSQCPCTSASYAAYYELAAAKMVTVNATVNSTTGISSIYPSLTTSTKHPLLVYGAVALTIAVAAVAYPVAVAAVATIGATAVAGTVALLADPAEGDACKHRLN